MAEAERYNEKELTQIFKAFDESMNDFKRMIGEIYQSYSKQTGLDRQALEAIVNSTDLDHLVKQIQKKTGVDISEAIMRNYKGRINRLQALQEQAKAMVDKLARETQNKATRALKTTVEEGYKRTLYDIGKGVGINPAPFATLDERTIKTMLKTKWVGKENYSQRIWTNMDQMTKKLQSAMLRGAVTGMSEAKLINEFKKELDIQRYKAERLIRTEMAYFHNQAELAAYDDLDVDEYMYIATLDSRTSEICRDLDGKHFPTKDGEPGKNMPPMHPNCRSTIAPYLGPEFTKNLQRRARQEGNGENEVIKYQTYREWEKSLTNKTNEVNNERAIASQRNMAMGLRQSPLINLDDEQISRIKQEAAEIEIPINVLSFNTGHKTGYVDDLNIIRIRNDINPDEAGRTARDLMSSRAVLAHEYYGHFMHAPSKYEAGDWRDEFEASYYAAINTPNLTDEERAMLMTDAYDRALEAGQTLEKTQEALKILYGYEQER